ncbi:MAG: ABC transporter transmembrane domain-containing protein, partial [Deltaproteobacteria bacterium]
MLLRVIPLKLKNWHKPCLIAVFWHFQCLSQLNRMPLTASNTLIQCLAAIAQHHGVVVNPERLIHDYAQADEEPKTAKLLQMATDIGLKAKSVKLNWKGLLAQGGVYPLIARKKDGAGVIVVGARAGDDGVAKIAMLDPAADIGAVTLLGAEEFGRIWSGEVILLKRTFSFLDTHQPFGFRWFLPEILKQKKAFRDIAIAAIAISLLGLASPMFFQLVIDKVLVHQSAATLTVLTVGVVAATIFESMFSYLRQVLLLSATNKIDMRVTRRAFSHLLSLPIDYFETTSAGVITRVMQQLEGIRNFLTGRLFFTLLDVITLLIYLPLLFTYSFKLAMIVLIFTLIIIIVIFSILPIYKRQLDILNSAEGQRQALLVETIHGMRTVKALAIEPIQRRTWDQLSANSIAAHFRVSKTA